MTGDRKKYYKNIKNRLGYTSFIKDHEKMSDDYEFALSDENPSIDQLDHYFIATVNELGIKKEMEIKKLKKEIKKLKKRNKLLNKTCKGYDKLIDLQDSLGGC